MTDDKTLMERLELYGGALAREARARIEALEAENKELEAEQLEYEQEQSQFLGQIRDLGRRLSEQRTENERLRLLCAYAGLSQDFVDEWTPPKEG